MGACPRPVIVSGSCPHIWLGTSILAPAPSCHLCLGSSLGDIYDVTPALSSSPPALSPLPALAIASSQRGSSSSAYLTLCPPSILKAFLWFPLSPR